jgi:hypothetical protein
MFLELAKNLAVITLSFVLLIATLYQIQRLWCWAFGSKAIYFTGWIGTPVHELSHVVGCVIFGHEIEKVSLFKPEAETGVLGYVEHRYNSKSLLHNVGCFWIGIAPLFGNLGVAYWLWIEFVVGAGEGANLQKLVAIYVCFSLIMHAAPSPADLKNSVPGIVALILILAPIIWIDPIGLAHLTENFIVSFKDTFK